MEADNSYELCEAWPQLLGGGARQATEDSEDVILAMFGKVKVWRPYPEVLARLEMAM